MKFVEATPSFVKSSLSSLLIENRKLGDKWYGDCSMESSARVEPHGPGQHRAVRTPIRDGE
jgi:hypothetical protein